MNDPSGKFVNGQSYTSKIGAPPPQREKAERMYKEYRRSRVPLVSLNVSEVYSVYGYC